MRMKIKQMQTGTMRSTSMDMRANAKQTTEFSIRILTTSRDFSILLTMHMDSHVHIRILNTIASMHTDMRTSAGDRAHFFSNRAGIINSRFLT